MVNVELIRDRASLSPADRDSSADPAALRGWNAFWFRPTDPTLLGVLRLISGALALYVHWIYGYRLEELIGRNAWVDRETVLQIRREMPTIPPASEWEVEPRPLPTDPEELKEYQEYSKAWNLDPRDALVRGEQTWSIFYYVDDPAALRALHAVTLVVMFLYWVGFQTRVTSVLAWVIAMQYIHRAPSTLFGMDTIMALSIFYLSIGPSGAAYSVDAWLQRRREAKAARAAGLASPGGSPAPSMTANVALRLMQVHLCFIYFASGLAKLAGGSWWNGTAVWRAVSGYEWAPYGLDFYRGTVIFLSEHRWAWEIVMSLGCLLTMIVEIGFPFLVWNRRLKPIMIALALTLHFSIGVFMGLLTFSVGMSVFVLSNVPPEHVRASLTAWAHRARNLLFGRKEPAEALHRA